MKVARLSQRRFFLRRRRILQICPQMALGLSDGIISGQTHPRTSRRRLIRTVMALILGWRHPHMPFLVQSCQDLLVRKQPTCS